MHRLSVLEQMFSQAPLESNPGQCLRLRHKKSTCRLCLENCPTDAIGFDDSLEINYSLCQGCGICANLCPTGVFELTGLSYESLLARLKSRSNVEFTCSLLAQEKAFFNVPCLGYLNEAVLTGVIANGGQAVRLNIGQCKNCNFAPGLRAGIKSLRQANRILALFGIPGKISASAKEPELKETELYSRRDFFSYLRGETQSRLAAAAEAVNGERGMTAKTKVTLEPILPKKRSLLLEHIKKLGEPVTDRAKADDLPFARVEISGQCNGCGMCVTFCPTGALKSYEEGDRQVIDFSLGHCLACNLCGDICPEGAIAYATYISPYDLVTDGTKILIEHRKSVCLRCGQSYVGEYGSKVCPNCSKEKGLREWVAKNVLTLAREN